MQDLDNVILEPETKTMDIVNLISEGGSNCEIQ